VVDVYARAYAVFNGLRCYGASGKRWIVADNYRQSQTVICQVFYQDIPTITRLVPLEYPPILAKGPKQFNLVKTYNLSRLIYSR